MLISIIRFFGRLRRGLFYPAEVVLAWLLMLLNLGNALLAISKIYWSWREKRGLSSPPMPVWFTTNWIYAYRHEFPFLMVIFMLSASFFVIGLGVIKYAALTLTDKIPGLAWPLLAAITGAPIFFVIWVVRDHNTKAQLETAQATERNQRYAQAITHLGAVHQGGMEPHLELRLGGIYSLKRLAEESPASYGQQVLEVLCAHVRTRSQPLGRRYAAKRAKAKETTEDASEETVERIKKALERIEQAERVTEDLRAIIGVLAYSPFWTDGHREQMDLTEAWLPKANLEGANLTWVRLNGADLSDAKLFKAKLQGAKLQGADLREADLAYAKLNKAKLSKADLNNAKLSRANLSEADLTHADLTHADLTHADLTHADLTHADLSKADLREAKLQGADLRKAKLQGANLSEAKLQGADLRKANLSEACLLSANLSEAKLQGADLREAGLSWAKLQGANLSEAKLQGANLAYAENLGTADFTNSIDLEDPPKGLPEEIMNDPKNHRKKNA